MSKTSSTYAIVGDGRVARHFVHYLSILGISFRQWARRTASDEDLQRAVGDSTHILLLISDSAIDGFIRDHPALSEKTLVHFSGSLVTPLASGAHPLMTFTEKLYSKDLYLKIPFVLDKGRKKFQDLLPGLSNKHFFIDPELRPLYHALCVTSGNFTTILWDRFFVNLQEKLGLPPEIAYPYLNQLSKNLKDHSVSPLTGPLARKELKTIVANLEALEGDPLQKVYYGFLDAMNLKIRENS